MPSSGERWSIMPNSIKSAPGLSAVDYQEFIGAVFQDVPEGEMLLIAKQPRLGGSFINGGVEDGLCWVTARKGSAVYVSVGTVAPPEEGKMPRRRKADVKAVYCLVLDDIGTKVNADDIPVAPSWVIETSAGSYQWGYLLEPTDQVDRFEAVVKILGVKGFTDPGASGANRLVRVPGSINIKEGRDRFASRITEWHPDREWSLDELATAFGLTEAEITAATEKPLLTSTGGAPAMENIDPVLKWLEVTGRIVEDRGEWIDLTCPWVSSHTGGGDIASYSPLGRGDGQWVQRRAFKCMHAHCKDQHFGEFIEWAKQNGGPTAASFDPLPWLQHQYVFVASGSEVVDLHARKASGVWRLPLADWANLHAGKIKLPGSTKPVPIRTAFLESPKTRKAATFAYSPGQPDLLTVAGQLVVNSYVEPVWENIDKPPVVFLEHMEYLLPEPSERETFLNWLAFKIQNPAKRSYAMVMVADGAYGTGRSWIRAILEQALQGKVKTATFPQLIGKGSSAEANYNDWAVGCQFLVIEEVKDNNSAEDFYHGYETFKSFVDTRVTPIRVNPKYGKTRDDKLFFNLLVFSNHVDALVLPEADRRVCVLTNPTERREPAYYERLEKSLEDDEPRRLYWWLKNRDVSAYDHVYPPMTAGKADMMDATQSPYDLILNEIKTNHESDLVTPESLKRAVMTTAMAFGLDGITSSPGGTANRIWRHLGTLRDEDRRRGARYSIDGKQVELRALRNRDIWKMADRARDRDQFVNELQKEAVGLSRVIPFRGVS